MKDATSALWDRERGFWTGGADYYRRHLAGDVLMVFPGMVLDRDATVDAIAAAPRWTSVTFKQERHVALSQEVVALQYRATAQREGEASPYDALVTSVYVHREGEWLLAMHQQTP